MLIYRGGLPLPENKGVGVSTGLAEPGHMFIRAPWRAQHGSDSVGDELKPQQTQIER